MRGLTQGVRTSAWGEYKASKNPPSDILLLSELYRGWAVTVAHCEANDSFLLREQPLRKSQGFQKVGTNLLDLLQLKCMWAFACVYTPYKLELQG